MELKERIKNMNILKNHLKKYIDCVPYDSRNKVIDLISDIDTELNYFKLMKMKRKEKNKQYSLF